MATSQHAISIVAEEIGHGILGGAAAGLTAAAVVAIGCRRDQITGSWLQVIPIAGAALAALPAVMSFSAGAGVPR